MTFWQFSLCMVFAFFCGVGFEKLLRRLDSRPSWGMKKERYLSDITAREKIRDTMKEWKSFPPKEGEQFTSEQIQKEAEKIRREGVFEKNFPNTAKAAKKHLPQMLKYFREHMKKEREHHPENDPGLKP